MLLQKTWEDRTGQLSQLKDLSSEGPTLHVPFYQAVRVLKGIGAAGQTLSPRNITSFSLPT